MGITALRLYLVKTFGEFLDKRELQRDRNDEHLFRVADEDIVVDFIADTGDGFNATYSVFRQLNPAHMGHPEILICGGDQVYPEPSARAYQEKFVGPLTDAVPRAFVDLIDEIVGRAKPVETTGEPIGRSAPEPELIEARVKRLEAILDNLEPDNRAWLERQFQLVAPVLVRNPVLDGNTAYTNLLARCGIEPAARDNSGAGQTLAAQAKRVETAEREKLAERARERAQPWLLAVPGNHDWYDGLSAFDQVFMHQRRIGGFETKQHRSYWAVALDVGGKRWWIWGIDLALDAHVDRAQLDYFLKCRVRTGEPVVLVLAAPLWTYAEHRVRHLYEFERKVIFDRGLRLAMVLSGDRHYYIRRESTLYAEGGGRRDDAPARITAGLGGAFTHAPHLEMVTPRLWSADKNELNDDLPYVADVLDDLEGPRKNGHAFVRSFPDERASRRMSSFRRSLSAWFRWNRSFTFIPWVLGLLSAATMLQTSRFWGDEAVTEVGEWQLALYLVLSFNLMVVIVLLLLAMALSPPDPGANFQRTQRVFWTLAHWLAQVAALWAGIWAAQEITRMWVGDAEDEIVGLVFILLASAFAAISFVVVLLGYFAVTTRAQMSVNALGSWGLDTSSAGFLRMRFTADRITVDVYGMTDIKSEKPSKIWTDRSGRTELHPVYTPCWERRPLLHVDHFLVEREEDGVAAGNDTADSNTAGKKDNG